MAKDFFSFESIRDKEGNVICYHVSMIGTLEQEGMIRMRTDLGENGDQKMAFGRLTVTNQDRRIRTLLKELGARVWSHSHDSDDDSSTDIISFTAKDWRADEAFELNEGDRVLIEGRAYVRKKNERMPDSLPEMSVTVTGMFVLGHRRQIRHQSVNAGLVPQE